MLNWYYTFYNEKSNAQVIGAISTPTIPGITFAVVREQLIRPYLKKQGINNPRGLTYERAKNAAEQTAIIEASEVTPYIKIKGIEHSTLTGYVMNRPKECTIEGISKKTVQLLNNVDEVKQNESLEELFNHWKHAHKYDSEYEINSIPKIEKDSFVEDGPVDKEFYERSRIKVLFILKEANVVFDKKVGVNGKYTDLRSVVEWINGVIDMSGQHELLKTIDGMIKIVHKVVLDESNTSLKQIAYMNINKRGGAGKATDLRILKAYVSRYSDYIRKEIEILKPRFVICCGKGTIEMISEIVLKNRQNTDFFKYGNAFYIKARHPSYSYMTTQQKIDEFEKQFCNAYSSE